MDSDSSSDSEDEFLTIGGSAQGGVDREALIRKKLLESFYGKASVDDTEPGSGGLHHARANVDEIVGSSLQQGSTGTTASMENSNMSNTRMVQNARRVNYEEEQLGVSGRNIPAPNVEASKDLDSPYFDAETHTSQHVVNSSVQTLLETEEQLALQVRTLDSTMQTLVYENYSRFIDANDAIRNIGVNVHANEQGISRLSKGMKIVDEQSRAVEDDLGTLRDAVAEKIRVKRLLTRLDALLKLPKTLQEQIAAGNYRKATKSYLTSTSILSKHSAGFESLKTIEAECKDILDEMLKELKRKLLHWSGRTNTLADLSKTFSAESDFNSDLANDALGEGERLDESLEIAEDSELPPEPPKTVLEIFECAGTLTILGAAFQGNEKTHNHHNFDTGLNVQDCKSMSLSASIRLLDRLFDAHHLEMHEAAFSPNDLGGESATGFDAEPNYNSLGNSLVVEESTPASKGKNLIPTKVIDGILEAATLYGMTFVQDVPSGADAIYRANNLVDFVSEAFQSFLAHVRSVLLERTLHIQRVLDDADDDIAQDDGDGVYEEISGAMSILLHCVRELASGLALPEVGISPDFASNLVDQTEDLTQAMVRRRVDQKFCDLRLNVLQDCLVPFATGAIADSNTDNNIPENSRILQLVQMASVALSDCLQLVDDTVRSIISGGNVLGASASGSIDLPVLKQAVEQSTRRFALWLAGTLEVIAGCESSDAKITFEACLDDTLLNSSDQHETENLDGMHIQSAASVPLVRDDISEISNQNDPVMEKVDSAIDDLLSEIDEIGSITACSDLTLAICEMCRLGERTVVENMNQSIGSHCGGEKKKSSGLFPSETVRKVRSLSEKDKITSDRFQLAASRILALYATNRGADAANILCAGLSTLGSEQEVNMETPAGPRAAAWHVLEIVKLTSNDCVNLFGGSRRAGPVPEVEVDAGPEMGLGSISPTRLKPTSLLQLDVERMFKEKVSVYPHPSQFLDFTRNTVVTIVLKVAFKALLEQTRQFWFSAQAYGQLQVDVEFLRHMIPHYVKDDFLAEGTNASSFLSNLLTDVMKSAGERCFEAELVADEYTVISAKSIVRDFMALGCAANGEDITARFVIAED